ncbi:hypothetical protein K1719_027340 [Acacia pycnantha]|nr:hypothetical protein K1719_027340 [Acacia pycnantha]
MMKWGSGIMRVLMSVMLIMGMLMSGAQATDISFGALGRDIGVGCSPKNPSQCNKPPANSYDRGCETATKCRSSTP